METNPSKESLPCFVLYAAESASSSAGIVVLLEIQLEEEVLVNGFHTS